MSSYRRPISLSPLFQIPLICLGVCLACALLFWLLGIGRPSVAVAIALDLSSSTYQNEFNAPDSIMAREIKAVQAYLEKNGSGILRQPNQVQVFGFATGVRPLTRAFSDDSQQVSQELQQSLQPDLPNIIVGGTNLDLAIQEGTLALAQVSDRCRELLLVTDGEVSVNPMVIDEAKEQGVKINALVIGTDAPQVEGATFATSGQYLSGNVEELDQLFTQNFFENFNNNWRWVLFWLGLAWIALMWVIVLPLDRWVLQGLFKFPMNLAGRISLFNALFWTAATPLIIWKLYDLFGLMLPFIGQC